MQHYPDRYRLAFRNYPLGRWPWSMTEAIAATAAAKQGKFWEMHDIMFLHQDEVEQPGFGKQQIMDWAKSIGLDVKKLSKDMDNPAIKDQVNRDREVGYINNIAYTPSFYIVPSDPNGKVQMITGDVDMKTVLANPDNPFWKGDLSGLTNRETQNSPLDPKTAIPR
jgi:protein-disulfide isomerase